MSKSLVVVYTNDYHNHLTTVQANTLKAMKAKDPNTLLLDAGDAVSAGNMGVRPGGEPILTSMSETGYDAMTMGNREFHIVDSFLRTKIRDAAFPVLCANMRWREDRGAALPVQKSIVKRLPNGVTAGVIGVTVPMVTTRMKAQHISAFVFDDPVEVMQREIARLRNDVDILIALTHIGSREDERLAAACPELDLVIGGHTHTVLREPKTIGSVPVLQAGWFGHFVGMARLEMETDGARPILTDAYLTELGA